MNYRSVAYGYLGVLIVFAGFWYEQENYLIHTEKKEELFKMIVGTQGGYGHYVYIAFIYMALFLMFVFKEDHSDRRAVQRMPRMQISL